MSNSKAREYEAAKIGSVTLLMIVLCGLFMTAAFACAILTMDLALLAILVAVGIVLKIGVIGLLKMKFIIEPTGVKACMFPFSYFIPYSEIESVELICETRRDFWKGLGLRCWKDRIAFRSRFGKAVLIRKSKGRLRRVLLSVSDPEAFLSELRSKIGKR